MRSLAPFPFRIPFEVVSAQHEALPMLVESLDQACLYAREARPERLVEADADVAGPRLQPVRRPWRTAGLEVQTGEVVPGDLGRLVTLAVLGRRLAQDLGGDAVAHRRGLDGPAQVPMNDAELVVVVVDDAASSD